MKISDLGPLLTFAKVVELKSFRAAAEALGAPRSTVSHKVAQLEDRLGIRLIERTTRTLRLTEAGSAYHRQIAPALEALEDADRAVVDLHTAPRGVLRITAPAEFGQLAVGEVVAEYMRRHPSVDVHVELTDRVVDLVEEGFDLALRRGPLENSTLVARKLGRPGHMRVYASRDYLRRRGEPRHPEDLAHHDCLVMTSLRQPVIWKFRQGRKRIAVEVRPHAGVNSFTLLCELAVAGHGVARLPEFLGERALPAGTLRTVLDAFVEPPYEWHAVYPSARHVSPKVRALIQVFSELSAAAHWGQTKKRRGAS
ncbi:Transcriptional regulator, LysR family [Labilithrix luteola]|uniref:Transcriptional regulator, LysR family n=1 Tax=Labilithrix luteola TaxID=1391654 RepID=A0A0K1QF59_9BACT|nr:LysR family transcriptional regulator [Labilithrix luteola]AKV04411.1 Transcriptional regulator, LysR family [Labilithrix luteola]